MAWKQERESPARRDSHNRSGLAIAPIIIDDRESPRTIAAAKDE